MRKPKYCKGDLVGSVGDAVNRITAGQYMYLGDRLEHHAWLLNMSVLTIWRYVRNRRMWYAVENTPEKKRLWTDADFREVD